MAIPASVPQSFKAPSRREPFTRAYWEGMKRGEFVLQTCPHCQTITHPPSPVCTGCLATDKTYRTASGRGTLYAFTVSYRPLHEEFKPDLPYVVALVDLEEGVRVMSWVTGCAPEALRIGMALEAWYEPIDGEVTLHRFRPVGTDAARAKR